ncbi:MAG TPA: aromatic-ring-hydroxylating dioxygenase subunit beta [Candidatus Sulfotelmatobacter sp.]|nr:aromatic-ring-hydroxylating dioxygenase subunit beta [Candidatus Sulfotelmatobacter sp.]
MTKPSRADVEDFLFREAALLDSWKLLEWAELFTDDGEYLVPATDLPEGEPGTSLFLIYDNRHRLAERAKRLLKKTAHAEFPHSRVRHLIGNVVLGPCQGGGLQVTCNFAVFRNRLDHADVFSGHSLYDLVIGGDAGYRIRRKRAVLDSDDLRRQGKLSIIL